jgi:hypothetical protein
MRNSRNDAVTIRALLSVLLLFFAVDAAHAANELPPAGQPLRLGVPQRLTPLQQPDAQSPDAASPDARPGAGPVKPTGISGDQGPIEVAPLAPIDPDWAGPLTPDQGGFPLAMWQGTPQALVVAVVPRLAVTNSPVLQGLTKRLLLSNAIAPGPRPAAGQSAEQADLVELRIERLIAAGQVEAANAVLALVPNRGDGEALERRRVELAFLSNDAKAACARVGDDVRRFQSAWWSRALIACQALTGDQAGAGLGLDLLREQKAPKDDAFDALVQIVGGRKVKLERLPDPSPLHLALLAAGKQPLPADALAGASPAVLRAWAGAEGAPLPQRLAAAERAAAFGAFPLDQLRVLYEKVETTPEDRANALTRAASEKGARGHALLYVAARAQPLGTARAETLQAMLAQGRKDGDIVLVARTIEPLVLELKPGGDLAWFAGDAARVLLLGGRAAEARSWVAIAEPAAARALFPLARLAFGRDRPWDEKQLDEALDAVAKADGDSGPRQAATALALLSAFDEAVGPAQWAPLFARLPLASLDLPGAPIWFDLPRAAADHRVGESVLLALVTAGEGAKLTAQPTRLARAVEGLRGAGLDGEARSLAVEAMLAAGF